ncbi:MAG TPA: hypothetical protein VHX87_04200 [Galbitalea sp.]|jgi:hypothetical protein|nr:hypothetical protein [Galbitalea sp.]
MRNTNARNSKRRIAAIAIVTLILVGGGGAATYAYWSAGGTGTGTAATGTSVGITAVQTSTITGLAPGGTAQTLSGNFTNTNSGPVYVTSVTASISSVTKAGGAPSGTCDATDYSLTNATMAVGAEVASGSAKGAWTGATIAFNDKGATLQDACKGATVNIAYAIS